MKKLVCIVVALMSVVASYAQQDVTKFLGIPVDGSKSEMLRKLKGKGFKAVPSNPEVLTGEFNGRTVNVYVATNKDKVCRIGVFDVNSVDEGAIKIRFNQLCRQFENNPKYISAQDKNEISEDEKISYEMTVNKKRYEAAFYQKSSAEMDTAAINQRVVPVLLANFTQEEIDNQTDEVRAKMIDLITKYYLEDMTKRFVWFTISEMYGKYYISMFYDNEYNRANGEDL